MCRIYNTVIWLENVKSTKIALTRFGDHSDDNLSDKKLTGYTYSCGQLNQ